MGAASQTAAPLAAHRVVSAAATTRHQRSESVCSSASRGVGRAPRAARSPYTILYTILYAVAIGTSCLVLIVCVRACGRAGVRACCVMCHVRMVGVRMLLCVCVCVCVCVVGTLDRSAPHAHDM